MLQLGYRGKMAKTKRTPTEQIILQAEVDSLQDFQKIYGGVKNILVPYNTILTSERGAARPFGTGWLKSEEYMINNGKLKIEYSGVRDWRYHDSRTYSIEINFTKSELMTGIAKKLVEKIRELEPCFKPKQNKRAECSSVGK